MTKQRLQATIPQDWQEADGYCLLQVCIPNSLEWMVAVKSAIHSLARGRYWRADGPRKLNDPNAVEIVDAQAIAREIYESICVTCLDDIKQLHQDQTRAMLLLYSALTRTEVNLDLENHSVRQQFGDEHKADSPFRLEGLDVFELTESPNITTLLAMAMTTYKPQKFGIETNFKDFFLNIFGLSDPPKSYFSHIDEDEEEQSLSKIIYDKECDTTVNVSNDIPNPTVNVTNTVPVPDVTVNVEPYDDANLVNAINSLMSAGQADTVTIEKAIDRLAQATLEKEIVQMVNTSTGVQTYKSDCCPDLSKLSQPDKPAESTQPSSPDTDLPTIREEFSKKGDCEPIVSDSLIEILDSAVNAVDWLEDELFELSDKGVLWLSKSFITKIALSSVAVRSAMKALGLISVTAYAVPSGEEVVITPLFAGLWLAYILIQLVLDTGIEGIKLVVGFMKYDRDVWKAIECQETSFDIDLVPGLSEKWVKDSVSDITEDVIKKSLGVKKFFQRLLNSSVGKQLEKKL